MNALSPEQLEFVQFGPAHLVAIAGLLVVSAGLSAAVRYSQSSKVKQGVCLGLAVFLLAMELFSYAFTAAQNGFGYFLKYDLPLHICGIAVYLTAYMLITKKQLVRGQRFVCFFRRPQVGGTNRNSARGAPIYPAN